MYLHSVEIDYNLEADRRTSAETCGLDDVFPPDDLGSGLYTSFFYTHTIYFSCILGS